VVSVGQWYSYIGTFYKIFRGLLRETTGKEAGVPDSVLYDTIRLPNARSESILRGLGVCDARAFWKEFNRRDLEERRSIIRKEIRAFPDAVRLLSRLREKDVRCAIITNAPADIARLQLRETGISGFFDQLVCFNYNEPRSKPDPWGVEKIIGKWGLPKDRVWMFGDSEQDVITGKNAGIRTGQLRRVNHPNESSAADVTGKDLIELWDKANRFEEEA